MGDAKEHKEVRTERDLGLPWELAEGYQATFRRLCRMFRARGVPTTETADLAQETITRTLLHLQRRGRISSEAASPGIQSSAGAANGHAPAAPPHEQSEDHMPAALGIDPLLRRIATNLLIDRARAAGPQLVPIEGAEGVAQPGLDPSEEVARRQQRRQVHRAIDDLSARHRTAMLLSLEGLTPAEIARHLGIQRNAADALLHRARRSLAKQLGTIGGLIRGLAVLVLLRARQLGRRTTDLAASVQPVLVGGVNQTLGIVAVLGAVLALSGPAVPQVAGSHQNRAGSVVRAAGGPAADAPAAESAAARPDALAGPEHGVDVGRARARVDAREHHVEAGGEFTNPATGDEESVLLGVVHEREEENRGTTGPLLDQATTLTCDALATCSLP